MPNVTVGELSREYKISVSKLRRMTRAGEIPCVRLGRSVRYELDRVDDALRLASLRSVEPAPVTVPVLPVPAAADGTPLWFAQARERVHAEARVARQAEKQRRAARRRVG